MAKRSLFQEFSKGIIKENPVLCLVLGTCPTLAVTTSAFNAIGMGVAATAVLVCSNAVISLLRKVIPDKVRIPAYITIIAGFVSVVQMLVKAFAPAINASLGIFLPLIVVNCIILGRAEMFAGKNPVLPSILDGLGMGVGFTAALLCMGIIRELLGSGTRPLLSGRLFFLYHRLRTGKRRRVCGSAAKRREAGAKAADSELGARSGIRADAALSDHRGEDPTVCAALFWQR